MITNNSCPNVSIPLFTENSSPVADPFDPARLRLSQDFVAAAGVKKLLTTVPVRKPSKEWFVQTHPDPSYRLQTYVIELKEDSETYLVDPSLWHELVSESTFSPRALFTAMNRQGVLFLWPIRLPGADGRLDDWSRSAMEAAQQAQAKWVRVQANMCLYVAKGIEKGFVSGGFFWGCCAAAPEKIRRREIDCVPAQRRRPQA